MLSIGGGLLFTVIVAGVAVSMIGGKAPVVAVKPVAPLPVVKDPQRTLAELTAEAEAVALKFLNAETVDEILETVRNPELAESRMRAFYPEGKIEAPGMSQFNSGAGLVTRGKLHSFPVLTRDHEERVLAFVETPQGLKIDWESWVGWSDIPWQKFLAEKPAGSHVFRVILAPVDYYNFGFSDDQKWQCYRLESPDMEHTIYGYAEKNSALDAKLRPTAGGQSVLMTLALKFPQDAQSDSQVEIERLVCEGWVEEGGAP
jgi:hypothetical protein